MRPIRKIIIHCTATPEGRHYTVGQIDRFHRQKGFKSIGYHFVIYLDGTVCPGRPVERIGAHCRGHNADSVGICYIGGIDSRGNPKDTRTPAQRAALIDLVRKLKTDFPEAAVCGHNQFSNKDCPSFNVQTDPDFCDL